MPVTQPRSGFADHPLVPHINHQATAEMALPQPDPTFCLGVATYRRPHDLARFLRLIAPQVRRRPFVRLVVVNDCSHSPEYQAVIDPFADILDYRVQPENRGPGAARNAAFADATEDYFIATDDDCAPPPHWLDWVIAQVKTWPEADILCGQTKSFFDGKPSYWQAALDAGFTYPAPAFVKTELLTAVTANVVYKKAAFQRVGGFEDGLRGATEDCEITQSILDSGGSYLVDNDMTTGHLGNTSLRAIRRRFYGYGRDGAFNAVETGNWKLAGLGNDGSWKSLRAHVRRRLTEYDLYGKGQIPGADLQNGLTRLLYILVVFSYEAGWKAGRRAALQGAGKGMPKRPEISDRFVDFEDPATWAVAFGQASTPAS